MNVTEVRVTVDLSNGDQHTFSIQDPEPCGGNPRFIWQQIKNGMTAAEGRLKSIADIYATQILPRGAEEE